MAKAKDGYMVNECARCGGQFYATPREHSKKYCSPECAHDARLERERMRHQKKPPDIRGCGVCGKEMVLDGRRRGTRYCSDKCREIAKTKYYKETFFYSLRWKVLSRDGFKCQYCGRSPRENGVKLHVDHIRPKKHGGKDIEGNLITACAECNLGKGDGLINEHNIKRYLKERVE